MTNVNDNAYWDNLPFVGWTIPDHLKIVGGKIKSANHGSQDDGRQAHDTAYRKRKREEKKNAQIGS